MHTSAAVSVFGSLVVSLLVVSSVAYAEPTRCKANILRNSAKFIQQKANALANCERDVAHRQASLRHRLSQRAEDGREDRQGDRPPAGQDRQGVRRRGWRVRDARETTRW